MIWLLRILLIGAGLILIDTLMPSVTIESYWVAVLFVLIFTLINFIVKPILILLTLPITLLTLGLFLFIINGFVFYWSAQLVDGFEVESFGSPLIASILMSIIQAIVNRITAETER